jgi:hypothetical protein
MYGITFPPIEISHNWRQTDGLMIARNFYEVDSNILYPRVDIAGDKSGIVGSEFPILNYLVYLLSLVFGFHDWFGRLIVLVFSSFGAFYFHRLLRSAFNETVAFNSTILLMASMWFSFSRKMIPDVFAASLCIMALYFAYRYLKEGGSYRLLFVLALATFGTMSKILTATILTALVVPMLDKTIPLSRKGMLSVVSTIVLGVVAWWYFIWVPYLNTIGFAGHFFMGLSFKDGLVRIIELPFPVFNKLFLSPIKYTGFAALMISFFFVVKRKHWISLLCFAVPAFSYLLIFVKTGSYIATGDNYYVLTLIPAMAFVIGYGLSLIDNRKIAVAALIIISVESIADQIYDFRIKAPFESLATLEPVMDRYSQREDLIAINCEPDYPTAMFMAHRRGWCMPYDLTNPVIVEDLKDRGCKLVLITKELYGDLELPYTVVYDSESFRVYRLKD